MGHPLFLFDVVTIFQSKDHSLSSSSLASPPSSTPPSSSFSASSSSTSSSDMLLITSVMIVFTSAFLCIKSRPKCVPVNIYFRNTSIQEIIFPKGRNCQEKDHTKLAEDIRQSCLQQEICKV